MAALIDNIKNWSDTQLMEDKNKNNSMSAAKYNEHQRQVRACKEEVE